MLGLDTETELISATCKAPSLVCVSYSADDFAGQGHAPCMPNEEGVFKWDGDGLNGAPVFDFLHEAFSIPLVLHNGGFDACVLAAFDDRLLPALFQAYEAGRVHDTMLREMLLDIGKGHFRKIVHSDGAITRHDYKLASVARRRLHLDMAKGDDTWRLRYGELMHVPLAQWPQEAIQYPLVDARAPRLIYPLQEAERDMGGHDLLYTEPAQNRAAFWLQLMSCWGIRIAEDRVTLLGESLQKEYEEIARYLIDEGLVRIKKVKGQLSYVRDTKAAQARMVAVLAEHGHPVRRTAPSKRHQDGQVSLDAEACEDSDDPTLEAYGRIAQVKGMLSKDIPWLSTLQIHGNFKPLVATGRTACGGGKDGARGYNLQNPKRKGGIRECFAPRPGTVFAFVDLDLAELRAFSQVCLNLGFGSAMGQAINGGQDVHVRVASTMLDIDYPTAIARYKAAKDWLEGGGDPKDGDPEIILCRQNGKNCNFGFCGGMGWRKYQRWLKANAHLLRSEEECQRDRQVWLATWPESDPYFKYHAGLVERGEPVQVHYSGLVRGGCSFTEACNTEFQALIAAAMKEAGFAVARECYIGQGVLAGSRIVLFVHDELVLEVPRDRGHDCAMALRDTVLINVKPYLPDVPPTATPYLAEAWSKNAGPVWQNGKLVPWQIAA